jgi:hypothetical protein
MPAKSRPTKSATRHTGDCRRVTVIMTITSRRVVTHMEDPLHEMKGSASNHGRREVLVNTLVKHRKVVDIGTNPTTRRRHDRLMAEVRLLAVHVAVAGG